jgi:microcin C transport system substrate-binding protein
MAHALSLPRRRLLQAALLWPLARAAQAGPGWALYDTPKYPPGFAHFDYADPRAPVGGTLWLNPPTVNASFDKLNPFTLQGSSAPGLELLVFESLMTSSWDEPNSMYGLLADDVEVAPDALAARFHLHPAARFSDGEVVTAAAVQHSFATLTGAQAAPALKQQYADIARVVVEAADRVRFEFRRAGRDLPLLAAAMPVFSPRWGGGKAFDQVVGDAPIASGPYRIERVSEDRDILYARRADYWGWQLPTRRGQFNFEHIGYKLYRDGTARLEGFKAGDFDLIQEFVARNWARHYVGPGFASGALRKIELPNHNPAGFQGFVMNLRRPLFQDVRVRKALALALDFEWLNRMLFYGQYRRVHGYFANSPFEAAGEPSAAELALLEPLRAQLPAAAFGALPTLPGTDPPGSLRANLLRARALLDEAGWSYRDGALRNARGEAFVFEYLGSESGLAPVLAPYVRALDKLGIELQYREVDFALYQERLDRFDYDMVTGGYPGSPSPGSELLDRFGAAAATVEGSDNIWGLRSPAVDALIQHVLQARSWAQLVAACRALDRVLVCGWYSVPHWYAASDRVAYAAGKFAWPRTLPLYYGPEDWAASCWWALPGDKTT